MAAFVVNKNLSKVKYCSKSHLPWISSCHLVGFELSVSRLQNATYFSIIAMSKKSHFTIFAIQNFVQNKKKTREFHLYCWDGHVCKVNERYLVDCLHHESRISTQIMVRDYCIVKCKKFSVCSRLLMALRSTYFAN